MFTKNQRGKSSRFGVNKGPSFNTSYAGSNENAEKKTGSKRSNATKVQPLTTRDPLPPKQKKQQPSYMTHDPLTFFHYFHYLGHIFYWKKNVKHLSGCLCVFFPTWSSPAMGKWESQFIASWLSANLGWRQRIAPAWSIFDFTKWESLKVTFWRRWFIIKHLINLVN